MNTELYHHGVKGMKWGVRRYQNKDGSLTPEGRKRYSGTDTVITKDKTGYRITSKDDDGLKAGMYASFKENTLDKNIYTGVYAHLLQGLGKEVVAKELKFNKDILIPNQSTCCKLMGKTLDDIGIRKDSKKASKIKEHLSYGDPEDDPVYDQLYKKASKQFDRYLNTGKVGSDLYDCLNIDFCMRNDALMKEISSDFYKKASKSGYSAIRDMNDSKYGNFKAKLPIILTDISNVKVSDIKTVSKNDIINAQKELPNRYNEIIDVINEELKEV